MSIQQDENRRRRGKTTERIRKKNYCENSTSCTKKEKSDSSEDQGLKWLTSRLRRKANGRSWRSDNGWQTETNKRKQLKLVRIARKTNMKKELTKNISKQIGTILSKISYLNSVHAKI